VQPARFIAEVVPTQRTFHKLNDAERESLDQALPEFMED
jgi:hypothetical protein